MTDSSKGKKPGELIRRSVLVGGAATAATAALPDVAMAQIPAGVYEGKAAVYMDPRYMDRFNKVVYAACNTVDVNDKIKALFPNRADLKWGFYQKALEPVPTKWGPNPAQAQAAFDNWELFRDEMRDDLEKQPAKFADPEYWIDPFDETKVADNMMEHLDEVIRIALHDNNDIQLAIKVRKKKKRHHQVWSEWDFDPLPKKLKKLTINVWCPDGGWQGYSLLRNKVGGSTSTITKLVVTWSLPAAPVNNTGDQILFIFSGLESISKKKTPGGVLQPVLQWTATDGWAARSWYVQADYQPPDDPTVPDKNESIGPGHIKSEKLCYTKAIPVTTPNATIIGTIVLDNKDVNGKCDYTCSLAVNGSTLTDTVLKVKNIPELTFAVTAIESYLTRKNPMKKDDYPASPITMKIIDLTLDPPLSPPWKLSSPKGHDFTVAEPTAGTFTFTFTP